jgi:threonine dehydrogenase-like Zn-dependent dehydrogenase
MRALLWEGATVQLVDRAVPIADESMAVVRVHLAGICNTDLELTKGYMGFRGVLGHEFVGEVSDGPAPWRGRRVVGEINFACGHCATCRAGRSRHCPARRVMGILGADGAFAEYVAVPVANLRAVPDTVGDDDAVFTEPLAAAFEILAQIAVAPGVSATVLGDGKLAQLTAQVLAQAGARVLAVGKHDDKLALLRRRGIDTVLLDAWRRTPAPLVVEATGTAQGFALAAAATEPRGTLVLKSTVATPAPLDLSPLVINEITLVGSRCGAFEPALQALADGRVDVRPLIAARHTLREGIAALQHAAQPGVLKVLIEIA